MLIHKGRIPLGTRAKGCFYVVLFNFFVIDKFICDICRFFDYLKLSFSDTL